jgi:hypothetical protein
VNEHRKGPDEFDEEELIRSEFESIVSGLSLDESSPNTYLDDLERIEKIEKIEVQNPDDGFSPPNPPRTKPIDFFRSAKIAIKRWFNRPYREDDGVDL